MTGWRLALLLAGAVAASVGATILAARQPDEPPSVAGATLAAPPPRAPEPVVGAASPPLPPVAAEQISTGRLSMERMPKEVGSALESFSDEIVRTAEEVSTRQARITGSCAPGSAIRFISDDGSVRCQSLPKGVASVSALAAIARMSTTITEAASVPGGVGRYQSGGPDDYLVVPIELPDGATVTALSYTFFDDSELDTGAFLYRSDDQALVSVSSSGSDERVRTRTSESVQLKKVDLGRYSYFVYFQVTARAGFRIMPISATVSYRLP